MALDMIEEHPKRTDLGDRIYEFGVSSVTVGLAVQAVGCEPAHVAKTLFFMVNQKAVLIVAAGDVKVDNHRYKEQLHIEARVPFLDEVTKVVGHSVEGVYPFGMKEGVSVYLDGSLERFDVVYPARGSTSSAAKFTTPELETTSECLGWIDVCEGWGEGDGDVYRYI